MWLREKNSNYLGISPGFLFRGEVGKVIPRGREAEHSEIETKTMNECGHSETQGKFVCLKVRRGHLPLWLLPILAGPGNKGSLCCVKG